MTKSLLLLGGVLPAVQLLRRAQEWVENVHIIAQKDDAIVFSNYGEKFLYKHPKECLSVIRLWIAKHADNSQEWIVIPCSEFFVQYIEELRDSGFEVFAPASQELSTFYDKSAMYTWLESLGVEVASFSQLDEQLDFTEDKHYIIKSAKATDDYNSPFKTKVVCEKEELEIVRRSIPKSYWQNFVIQRLYENNKNISYGGIWMNGQEVASIITRQVRQYPQGVTSYAVKETDAKNIELIKLAIEKISSNVKLHGFIELEFIKNEMGLYPIDLNPRLWGWSNFLFYNYPQVLSVIFDKPPFYQLENYNIMSWSNIWRDIPAILKSENSIILKIKLIFALLKISKKDFIFWGDIKPEFSAILQKIGQQKK